MKNRVDTELCTMEEAETPNTTICGRSLEEFLNAIQDFHGFKAPGVVLGGFLVDLAQELMGPDVEADAIVETTQCLPDAVQIFTPCTIGNGWLKILDWSKFALSLYDKKKLTGYRVRLDLKKAHSFPNLYNWYMGRVSKKELPLDVLLETILLARRSVLSFQPVRVTRFHEKKKKGKTAICSGCGEAYPIAQGDQCMTCQGQGYYTEARTRTFHIPGTKRLEILNYLDGDHREEMIRDVRRGLTQSQKAIPSKYFYDAHGSRLFDRICCTQEYYLTTTELSILDRCAPQIMDFFSEDGGHLIELGSGSNTKIKKLLDAVNPSQLGKIRYVPVDISKSCLMESSRNLLNTYKDLNVLGIAADFTRHMNLLPQGRKLILFFGSTIGNFSKDACLEFLTSVRQTMTPDDRFLVGIDMIKSTEIIEKAYNDTHGITREFNKNILANVNRELNADFNPDHFDHLAFFNPEEEWIEMHLRALRPVNALIRDLPLPVDLKEGETIHTEICRKFSRESATDQFRNAGLMVTNWYTDDKGWFSLVEIKAG